MLRIKEMAKYPTDIRLTYKKKLQTEDREPQSAKSRKKKKILQAFGEHHNQVVWILLTCNYGKLR